MRRYKFIKHAEAGIYLSGIHIGRTGKLRPLTWTRYKEYAIHFENEAEAEATIEFIGSVIDWELEEQLEIVEVN